jgi:hypothetical protein
LLLHCSSVFSPNTRRTIPRNYARKRRTEGTAQRKDTEEHFR